VIYIPLYLYKSLHLTALLYFVFLLLCIMGLREWRKKLLRRSPPVGILAQ
jgi:nicotinamide mononucleotide transporter